MILLQYQLSEIQIRPLADIDSFSCGRPHTESIKHIRIEQQNKQLQRIKIVIAYQIDIYFYF